MSEVAAQNFNDALGVYMQHLADAKVVHRVMEHLDNDYDIMPHEQTAERLQPHIRRYEARLNGSSEGTVVSDQLPHEARLQWARQLIAGQRARLSEILTALPLSDSSKGKIVEAFVTIAAYNADRLDLFEPKM